LSRPRQSGCDQVLLRLGGLAPQVPMRRNYRALRCVLVRWRPALSARSRSAPKPGRGAEFRAARRRDGALKSGCGKVIVQFRNELAIRIFHVAESSGQNGLLQRIPSGMPGIGSEGIKCCPAQPSWLHRTAASLMAQGACGGISSLQRESKCIPGMEHIPAIERTVGGQK
jgi:hypothetical protein